MKFKSISMTALILFGSIFGQSESLEIEDAEPSTSLQGAFGAVTIDGKIWNQMHSGQHYHLESYLSRLIWYYTSTKMAISMMMIGIFFRREGKEYYY